MQITFKYRQGYPSRSGLALLAGHPAICALNLNGLRPVMLWSRANGEHLVQLRGKDFTRLSL